MLKKIDRIHAFLFSSKNLKRFESSILFLAVVGFIVHLGLIYINQTYEVNILKGLTIYLKILFQHYIPHFHLFLYMKFFY